MGRHLRNKMSVPLGGVWICSLVSGWYIYISQVTGAYLHVGNSGCSAYIFLSHLTYMCTCTINQAFIIYILHCVEYSSHSLPNLYLNLQVQVPIPSQLNKEVEREEKKAKRSKIKVQICQRQNLEKHKAKKQQK